MLSTVFIYIECVKSFLLCIVDKMAQDVGMVWMCCGVVPILFSWLFFERSIPTCACFHLENFFVTCSCFFF